MGFYGGYKNSFANDWIYDLGLIRYYCPSRFDNLGGYRQPDTTEMYGAIGYKWVTLNYSKGIRTYTFDVNESRGAIYLDLSNLIPLGESDFSLLAHVDKHRVPP